MSRLALITVPVLLLPFGCDPHHDEDDDDDCEPSSGPVCGEGTIEIDGECVPDFPEIICGPGTTEVNGECVSDVVCGDETVDVNGECVPENQLACGIGTIELAGECECVLSCGHGTSQVGDQCLPDSGGLACGPDTEELDGICLCNDLDGCDDADADEICDSLDPCPDDPVNDPDGDGICATDDICPYNPDALCTPKRVFITSEVFQGDFGGLDAGDAICQGLAEAAGLAANGEVFRVWLSTHAASPSTRFETQDTAYELVDGTRVSGGFQDLVTLDAAITLDENGAVFSNPAQTPGFQRVWTNTGVTGGPLSFSDTCFSFTSSSGGFVWTGHWPSSDFQWTQRSPRLCSEFHPLYCFEQ